MIYTTCLYLLLASPSHTTREFATRGLHHRVQGWPHLYGEQVQRWARSTPSPERRHRLVRPLVSYRSYLAAAYVPSGIPVWPVCDCLPGSVESGGGRDRSEGSRWRDRAIDAGMTPTLPKGDEDPGYGPWWFSWRAGTELMARQMIREGADPRVVDALLLEMWKLELACESDCSGRRHTLESWTVWEGGYPLPR